MNFVVYFVKYFSQLKTKRVEIIKHDCYEESAFFSIVGIISVYMIVGKFPSGILSVGTP